MPSTFRVGLGPRRCGRRRPYRRAWIHLLSRITRVPSRSDHRVFDRFHGPGAHALARGLGLELLLLFGERVDPLTCGASRLLDDHELGEPVQHKGAGLLQLLVPDGDERFDNLLDVLAGDLFAVRFHDGIEDRALREGFAARLLCVRHDWTSPFGPGRRALSKRPRQWRSCRWRSDFEWNALAAHTRPGGWLRSGARATRSLASPPSSALSSSLFSPVGGSEGPCRPRTLLARSDVHLA